MAGNAGVALGALRLGDVDLAELAVTPYLSKGEPTEYGVTWENHHGQPARRHHVSHGTLGVAYALAATAAATGRSDLMELCLAAVADVAARNDAGSSGFLVPHSDPVAEAALGACNSRVHDGGGSSGWARSVCMVLPVAPERVHSTPQPIIEEAPVPDRSFVVTGGAAGVGRAIVERLADDGHVVIIDVVEDMQWGLDRVLLLSGDARDPEVTTTAAETAESLGALSGWVNNAAIFEDASLDSAAAPDILDLITANLALAVSGCHTAVNHYLAHARAGAIVNVSSHQAQRAVRGALPYATAKAAIEGLTRAIAVDHGPHGIRTNAVALGSISTPRYEAYRTEHPNVDAQMAALHPLGRVGASHEVADTAGFLLSDRAAFINGVVLPVDGGRAANGADPEAT